MHQILIKIVITFLVLLGIDAFASKTSIRFNAEGSLGSPLGNHLGYHVGNNALDTASQSVLDEEEPGSDLVSLNNNAPGFDSSYSSLLPGNNYELLLKRFKHILFTSRAPPFVVVV